MLCRMSAASTYSSTRTLTSMVPRSPGQSAYESVYSLTIKLDGPLGAQWWGLYLTARKQIHTRMYRTERVVRRWRSSRAFSIGIVHKDDSKDGAWRGMGAQGGGIPTRPFCLPTRDGSKINAAAAVRTKILLVFSYVYPAGVRVLRIIYMLAFFSCKAGTYYLL